MDGDGIKRISEFIKSLPYRTKRCIFACSNDKDKELMVEQLEKVFDEIIFTAFAYKRHADADYLFNISEHPQKKLVFDLNSIIETVWSEPYDLNLFLGSLYFVSEIRPLLIQKTRN